MQEYIFEQPERNKRRKRRTKVKRIRKNVIIVFAALFALLASSLLNNAIAAFSASDSQSLTNRILSIREQLLSEDDVTGQEEDSSHYAGSEESSKDSNSQAWNLILINKWNSIPDGYEFELTQLSNGQAVDKRIYPSLQDMFDDARSQGVNPVVASGYRTAEKQLSLMDEKIDAYRQEGYSKADAKQAAEYWVASPGTSEHEIGIAVDINADGVSSDAQSVYNWLNANSWKYGFILRYPPEKSDITGIAYEPWHYRYVGIEAATEIYNQGICLEEYIG